LTRPSFQECRPHIFAWLDLFLLLDMLHDLANILAAIPCMADP
jgi:hypothetical protein